MTDESIERLKWLIKLPKPENPDLADQYFRLISRKAEEEEPSEVER